MQVDRIDLLGLLCMETLAARIHCSSYIAVSEIFIILILIMCILAYKRHHINTLIRKKCLYQRGSYLMPKQS